MKDSYLLVHIEWLRCYQNVKEFNLILKNNSLIDIHITQKGNLDGYSIKELFEKLNITLTKNDIVYIGQIDDKNIYFYNHSLNNDMNEDEEGYIHDMPPIVQEFNESGELRICFESRENNEFTSKAVDLLYFFLGRFGKNILEICCKKIVS